MPVNGRRKGKVGEQEFCHWLTEKFGCKARRSQQYCGDAGDADVTTEVDPLLFIDVKRVERLMIYAAMAQVKHDARDSTRIPVVMHKKNRGEWLAVLRAEDLVRIALHHPQLAELRAALEKRAELTQEEVDFLTQATLARRIANRDDPEPQESPVSPWA